MSTTPFDLKLARIFADVTDNLSSDADPEMMAMHVAKLCRFVTMIGGRDVDSVRAELDRFSELYPLYSMLETLRVTMRRLLSDSRPHDEGLLNPLASARKDSLSHQLQSLQVAYTVHMSPPQDASVLSPLFEHVLATLQDKMMERPVNILLLLDFAVKRGRELGLHHPKEEDEEAFEEERDLLQFFRETDQPGEPATVPDPPAPPPVPPEPPPPSE
jgi:hypothetical protein